MYSGIKRKETWENPVAKQIPNESIISYTKTAKDLMQEQIEQIAKSVLKSTNSIEAMANLRQLKGLEDVIRRDYTKQEEIELLAPLQEWFKNFKLEF